MRLPIEDIEKDRETKTKPLECSKRKKGKKGEQRKNIQREENKSCQWYRRKTRRIQQQGSQVYFRNERAVNDVLIS